MIAESSIVPGVRKIAVLRANALGDYVFATPALYAPRAAYPGAEIVLLGKRWHADFLTGRPGPVDRVEVVPPLPGFGGSVDDAVETALRDEPDAAAFLAARRAERFDLAVRVHGGGRHANPLVAALGADLTVGLRDFDAPGLDRDRECRRRIVGRTWRPSSACWPSTAARESCRAAPITWNRTP